MRGVRLRQLVVVLGAAAALLSVAAIPAKAQVRTDSEYAPECTYAQEPYWRDDDNNDGQPGPDASEFVCLLRPGCTEISLAPSSVIRELKDIGQITFAQSVILRNENMGGAIGICEGDAPLTRGDFDEIIENNPWLPEVLENNPWIRDATASYIDRVYGRFPQSVFRLSWMNLYGLDGETPKTDQDQQAATPEEEPESEQESTVLEPEEDAADDALVVESQDQDQQAATPEEEPESEQESTVLEPEEDAADDALVVESQDQDQQAATPEEEPESEQESTVLEPEEDAADDALVVESQDQDQQAATPEEEPESEQESTVLEPEEDAADDALVVESQDQDQQAATPEEEPESEQAASSEALIEIATDPVEDSSNDGLPKLIPFIGVPTALALGSLAVYLRRRRNRKL